MLKTGRSIRARYWSRISCDAGWAVLPDTEALYQHLIDEPGGSDEDAKEEESSERWREGLTGF